MFTTEVLITAFLLTLFAGMSTAIGSALAFFTKRTNTKFLSLSLGFSAGVMIYISFVEIFPNAQELLIIGYGSKTGTLLTTLAFFLGIILIAIIDKLVPNLENPHEIHKIEELKTRKRNKKLYKMGLFTALAIAIHNFPEGLVTFVSVLNNLKLGISIAIAIAIHNIPEGIAVSIPIFYATGSRKKAFLYSALSGLSEPLGAVFGYLILAQFLNNYLLGMVLAFVAGIMVFISLDQLLPAAEQYGEHHLAIYGLIVGMAVMAISLLLF